VEELAGDHDLVAGALERRAGGLELAGVDRAYNGAGLDRVVIAFALAQGEGGGDGDGEGGEFAQAHAESFSVEGPAGNYIIFVPAFQRQSSR
jgi:hypothetical protein